MAIGENIQKLLKKKRMSVAELSRKTGIASTSIYMAIKRDSNKMNIDSLEKIANALEIDVRQLVDTDHKTDKIKPECHKCHTIEEWYTCGNCGFKICDIGYNFCPNCGCGIKWDSTRCLEK